MHASHIIDTQLHCDVLGSCLRSIIKSMFQMHPLPAGTPGLTNCHPNGQNKSCRGMSYQSLKPNQANTMRLNNYIALISACVIGLLVCCGTVSGSSEPIWISPTNVNYTYPSDYFESYVAERGVWATIDVGAGARGNSPLMVMDSKGILWILAGLQINNDFDSYLFTVWNYNPKTDQYRYVWGSNETVVGSSTRAAGELGVANVTNHPGGIQDSAGTIDNNDNIWMISYDYTGELWMFNTTSMVFTRMSGPNQEYAPSIGANPGQPGEDVWPGYNQAPCMAADSQNNIWLLTGLNYNGYYTNAVWHFNTTSFLWTFVAGSIERQPFTNATFFGGTYRGGCFMDENDRVWLFGGYGGAYAYYGSIWTFDTRVKREYELEYGPDTADARPVSVSADFSADNHPGATEGSLLIDRMDGTLLLVPGYGFNSEGDMGALDQAWLFNKTSKFWKLIYGNISTFDTEGVYSKYRQAGSTFPGSSYFARTDGKNFNGDVYIVGGTHPSNADGINRKDIWLIPNDQCSSPTANKCSVNAQCIEEMIGYSCTCKEGYTGDGFTCDAIPVAAPTSTSTPSSPSTPTQKTSGVDFMGLSSVLVALSLYLMM